MISLNISIFQLKNNNVYDECLFLDVNMIDGLICAIWMNICVDGMIIIMEQKGKKSIFEE